MKAKTAGGDAEFRVHPAANIFPMMPDDELAELARDIKQKGLLHPVIMGRDADGDYVVDGRNRLLACAMAGIEPRYVYLENNEDPRGVVASANVARRNLKASQLAMSMAMIYPEPDKPGRGHKGKAEESSGFSQKRLAQARQVLAYSKAWAREVLVDRMGLDEALDKVREDRQRVDTLEAKKERLTEEAPDLAAMVGDDRLTVAQAWAALDARKREEEQKRQQEREERERLAQNIKQLVVWADRPAEKIEKAVIELVVTGHSVTTERFDHAIRYLSSWRAAIAKVEEAVAT